MLRSLLRSSKIFARTLRVLLAYAPSSAIYTMNELYNEYIKRNGKVYRYDPDYDCYYAVPVKLSKFDQWAWIVVIVLLASLCYWVEYIR